jgi:hypothetical protein
MAIPPDIKIRLEQLRNEMAARAEEQLRRQQAQQNAEKMSKQFVPGKAAGGQPSMAVMRLAIGGQGPRNWLKGSVDPVIKPLLHNMNPDEVAGIQAHYDKIAPHYDLNDPREARELAQMREHIQTMKGHEAVNKWVQGNLANYIRKQMASPNDPIRKLAEEGIVHMPPDQMGTGQYLAHGLEEPYKHRQRHGGERLAHSNAAKAWEDASDVAMGKTTVGDLRKFAPMQNMSHLVETWMEKADPNTELFHATDNLQAQALGFDHIVDVLKQDIAEGRIRPEQLSKVSIEQAVRRVHEYDQERKKAMEQATLKQTEGMPVHKDYGNGFKWIELTLPKDLPEGWTSKPLPSGGETYYNPQGERHVHPGMERLSSALKYEGDTMGHCVGGYCPDVAAGRSRIFSLRDAKNQPHVTIEVNPSSRGAMSPSEFYQHKDAPQSLLQKINEAEAAGHLDDIGSFDDFVKASPEYNDYLKSIPPVIRQIKGKANTKPKSDYIPYVQDFVKSGNWSDVNDKQNAEIRDITKTPMLHGWLKDNNVAHDRYLTEQEYNKHESDMLADKLGINQQPQQKAKGGEVKTPSLDTMKLALNKQGMYSPLEKAAMAVPRTKGTPAEFMAEVSKQPGFRKDEVEDRRISLPEQKMTKEEFLGHLKNHPAPLLNERVLGGDQYREELDNVAKEIIGDDYVTYDDLHGRDQVRAEATVMQRMGYDPETKYDEWALPGGDNYREVLLNLPRRGLTDQQREQLMWYEADMRRGKVLGSEKQKRYEELKARQKAEGQDYHSSHWEEHPNVLAHLRLSDRTGPNGEKILHVDEVQSDWHQQGRKEGYQTGEGIDREKALRMKDKIFERFDAGEINEEQRNQLLDRVGQMIEAGKGVPDAPFKKNWHELAMKHVLGMAANGGYDGIAITPGDEQVKRWEDEGLRVHYDKKLPDFLNKIGKPHGAQVGTIAINTPQDKVMASNEDIAQFHGMPWDEFAASPDRSKLEKQFWQAQKNATTPVHYFPITDSLRQQVKTEGLPQYERGGNVHPLLPDFED